MKIKNRKKYIACIMGLLTMATHCTIPATQSSMSPVDQQTTSVKAPRPDANTGVVCSTCVSDNNDLVQDCVCQELTVEGNATIEGKLVVDDSIRTGNLTVDRTNHTKKIVAAYADIKDASITNLTVENLTVTGTDTEPELTVCDLNVTCNLFLPDSEDPTGNILKGGSVFVQNYGVDNIFIGKNSGNFTLTTGTAQGNTAVGQSTLSSLTTGADNTAMGVDALLSNTTGASNVAFGDGSLSLNTITSNNTAIGTEALAANAANNNTAVGYGAALSNITGTDIVAVGYNAASASTTVSDVTAVGYNSLALNTIGGNTAVGSEAAANNTTGAQLTALGFQALNANTSGNNNTGIGDSSLGLNTIGANNTAVGFSSLSENTSGSSNTSLGVSTLEHSNASNNTAIGAVAMALGAAGNNNTAVGYSALNNNTAAGNTAIGSQAAANNTSGVQLTAVGYQALNANTTGSGNTAIGYGTAVRNTTGLDNTAIGYTALNSLTTGSNNIAIGSGAGQNFTTSETNNIDIGNNGVTGENNTIRIGVQGTQTATYIAGISGVTPAGTTASVVVNANGQLGVASSPEALKQNITPIDQAALLGRFAQIVPVSFNYIGDPTQTLQYGMILEQLLPVFPELIVLDKDGNPYTIAYQQFTALLIAMIQQLQTRVAALEGQNLESDVTTLESEVTTLETEVTEDLNQNQGA